ncbi:MAG: DKNYY domain-containing protein [Gemmatimonadaceae bacterium]|nr:DKNYY domain-containing protein [Chitinophagaceae bacterium]
MFRAVLMLAGFFSFLSGCSIGNPYKKKNGKWFYDDYEIPDVKGKFQPLNNRCAKDDSTGFYRGSTGFESDGRSFAALDIHYAKDARRVFYCDTYRDGQEYFFYKHNRINTIREADAASFVLLDGSYAKDKNLVFCGGVPFPVADIASFEVLENGFTRDKVQGYYNEKPVSGSDGKTFTSVASHYAKDVKNVYYCFLDFNNPDAVSKISCSVIPGARPDSFQVLEGGYAKDDQHVFFNKNQLSINADGFELLTRGYARSGNAILYDGIAVKNADAATFSVVEPLTDDSTDARDASGRFSAGKKIRE